MIARTCALARELGALIAAEPELELLAPIQLNIVCFRYRGADSDQLNREIVADLHEEGMVAPSLTRLDDRTAIRAAIVNHRTGVGDIQSLVACVLAAGRQRTRRQAA